MKPIAETRRDNLVTAIHREGVSDAEFARRIGKDRRQVSAWRNGGKVMSDDTAREIERALRFPANWMDAEHSGSSPMFSLKAGAASQLQRTDRAKMRDAMTLLKHLAELQGNPDLATDPDAIAIALDFLVEFDTPPGESNVLDLAKRLAAKIRGEVGNATQERSKTA